MEELVGREAELAQLLTLLGERRPARVVLRGALGIGKTTLLRGACAASEEWSILPGEGAPGVYVEPRDTTESVLRKLTEVVFGDGSTVRSPEALTREIRNRAPVMLVIERYRPSPGVDTWLDELLNTLRSGGLPIVAVVTDPSPRPARVTAEPDLELALAALDPAPVRLHLAPAAAAARPRVDDAELDHYVERVRREPALLRPLERVLAASAAPSDGRGA